MTPINLIGESQIDITWATRNRLLEETVVLRWTDAPVAPEVGQFTLLETFTPDGTPITRHEDLDGSSYTLAPSDIGGHPVVRVRVKSIFNGVSEAVDGLESLQGHELTIRVEEGGWGLSWGLNWGGGAAQVVPDELLVATLHSSASSTADLSTYTFEDLALGPASEDRLIAVCVFARNVTGIMNVSFVAVGQTLLPNNIQIQGDTDDPSARTTSAIFWGLVPAGTTGDVLVVLDDEAIRCAVAVYAIPGASEVAHDSFTAVNTSTLVDTIDVAAGGAVVAISGIGSDGTETAAWTGATETLDAALEAANYSSAAESELSEEVGRTVQVIWTDPAEDQSMAVVSFAP